MKPRKLSFDLNLVDLCASGYWFCRACYKVTERQEREQGLMPACLLCGSPRIKWFPPISTEKITV